MDRVYWKIVKDNKDKDYREGKNAKMRSVCVYVCVSVFERMCVHVGVCMREKESK